MQRIQFYFITLLVVLIFCFYKASSQVAFSNPSFEGEIGDGRAPEGWYPCNEYSTPDTQPGVFNVTTPPFQGKSYLGMVCRDNGSNEGVGQNLNIPLQAGTCYVFSMDLARSDEYYGYNRPALLRIWAGEKRCEKKELLWTSPSIEHVAWRKYSVELSPRKAYAYIVIEVYYSGAPYSGNVLIDNLSQIKEAPLGKLDLGKDTTLCMGDKLELKADFPSATTTWSEGSIGSTLVVEKEGTYKVKVSNGCSFLEDEIVVSYRDCIEKFNIPNVFTPNGDKANETFFIEGLPRQGWQLLVFSRWGKLLYSKEDYEGDWQGEGLPTGTYYYQLSKGGIKPFKGWVLILR